MASVMAECTLVDRDVLCASIEPLILQARLVLHFLRACDEHVTREQYMMAVMELHALCALRDEACGKPHAEFAAFTLSVSTAGNIISAKVTPM